MPIPVEQTNGLDRTNCCRTFSLTLDWADGAWHLHRLVIFRRGETAFGRGFPTR